MHIPILTLAAAKHWARSHPTIIAVYEGFKYVKGQRTPERCIVFGVKAKQPRTELPYGEEIPARFGIVRTDVIETPEFKALALTQRLRPCPAGLSVGHVAITAGTFGAPVKRGASDDWLILSNNHVLANSNTAAIGDEIVQPGKHDGGTAPADRLATLEDFVAINFDGAQLPGKKNTTAARAWWSAVKAVGNFGARSVGCPYRVHVSPHQITQPSPNLVDAAIARPLDQADLAPVVHQRGPIVGIRDAELGMTVVKTGRTTGPTSGMVEGINGDVQVSYGAGQIARFTNQVFIRGEGGVEFSAGGDSGSAILAPTEEGLFLCGLLFAGGSGQTIANRISDVVALLGIRV